ncbi:hypothetical protein A0J57_08720 [Sphingobium sp. 22B]|nr:hypothetical protein AXW74_06215 [Sphingobium sp. AM]KYC32705.1 hypothetical protein A0J57_08720 [Sphingobium sp. 22B]OAP31595.1 hypothetical protein A8O16_12175 [Sphingobium sp. 20006FA]
MTGVRGMAALIVMIYHFERGLQSTSPLSTMLNHGYLSVDLFFVLSGFVLSHVYGQALKEGSFTLRAFLLHRLARIYPVYIVATSAILAIGLWKRHDPAFGADVIVSNVFMLQSIRDWPSIDPPAWSVSAELIAYLLFPILARLCFRSRPGFALMTALAALATIMGLSISASLHWIGSPIAKGQLDLFYAPYTLIRCLAGFTLGQLIWRLHAQGAIAQWAANNAVQVGIGLSLLCLTAFRGTDFFVYLAIIGLIFCLSASRGALPAIFGSRPMHFLGRISFPVYLTHYKAMGLLSALQSRLPATGPFHIVRHPLAVLSAGLAVICLSWLVHEGIERPCRKFLRRAHWLGGGSKALPA